MSVLHLMPTPGAGGDRRPLYRLCRRTAAAAEGRNAPAAFAAGPVELPSEARPGSSPGYRGLSEKEAAAR